VKHRPIEPDRACISLQTSRPETYELTITFKGRLTELQLASIFNAMEKHVYDELKGWGLI
jgi:hypothetical protein